MHNTHHCYMKESGIPWVGYIPESWKIYPAGRIFEEVKSKNKDNLPYTPLSFRYGEIVDKKTNGAIDENTDEALTAYTIVHPGVIMLNGLNLNYDFITQRVALVKKVGIITSAYLAVFADEKYILPEFATYLLKSYDYKMVLHGIGSGVRKTLKYTDFCTIRVALPTLEEQTRIVAYLNDYTSQIESIIIDIKDSIEEYKRWKASTIFECVTKGTANDIITKNSGIHWLGLIPKNWNIVALKQLCTMQAGKNLTSEQILDEGDYPVYGGNGIRGYYNSYNNDGDYIIIGRQGARCGNAHLVHGKFWATEHAVVTTCKENTDINYLFYLITAMNLNQYASNAAAQPGLSVNTISNIKTVLPPMEDQKTIARQLAAKCNMIDELLNKKELLITDLEDYKKSLIFETVTGKRKVV